MKRKDVISTDMPEVPDWNGAVRGKFYRSEQKPLPTPTRLPAPAANTLTLSNVEGSSNRTAVSLAPALRQAQGEGSNCDS